jgi:regulatory protein
MVLITGIIELPRRTGRYFLELDPPPDADVIVSVDIIARLGLAVGREVDDRLRAALDDEAAALATFDRAAGILALRPHSAQELRRKLTQKGETPARAQAAVERMLALGVLNDAEYARQLAQAKVVGKGVSRRRLQQEMYKRGVARDVGEAAIAEVLSDESVDTAAVLDQLARKKLRTLDGLDAPTRRRRLYGFLARRGYEPDEVRGVVERVLREV